MLRVPVTVAVAAGGLLSGFGASTTANCTLPGVEVLPASSVARNVTVCSPTAFTVTGAV